VQGNEHSRRLRSISNLRYRGVIAESGTQGVNEQRRVGCLLHLQWLSLWV